MAEESAPTSTNMVTYVAKKESILTMNATIMKGDEKYATLKTHKFRDAGVVTLFSSHSKFHVKKKKPYKGMSIFPSDDDTVEPCGRAWRGGILSKGMNLVLEGQLFRLVSDGLLKSKYQIYMFGEVPEGEDDAADQLIKNKDEEKIEIGTLKKDGMFQRTYTLEFNDDIPEALPALVLWMSAIFERQDAAVAGAAAGAGAF